MLRAPIVLFVLLTGCATTSSTGAEPGNPSGPISPLQFLTGSWRGEGREPGILLEEEWSHPVGSSQLGTFRVLAGGRAVFYELAAIEPRGDDTVLVLRHFGPGLEPKGDAITFRFDPTSASPDEAAFVTVTPDDVKRIVYRRRGNVLTITLERESGAETFTFQRKR